MWARESRLGGRRACDKPAFVWPAAKAGTVSAPARAGAQHRRGRSWDSDHTSEEASSRPAAATEPLDPAGSLTFQSAWLDNLLKQARPFLSPPASHALASSQDCNCSALNSSTTKQVSEHADTEMAAKVGQDAQLTQV